MADNFGLKIGIEGEKEFKKALSEINQSFKVLGSEMKLVSSQFDKNDKSVQALSARNTVLNKEIDAQRQKIETLRAALQNASESFGENDRRTQNWQIQLNNAEAALNGMERELSANERAIESLSRQETEAADATERLSQEISRQEEELAGMKRAYSNAVLEYGKGSSEAKELEGRISQLSGELRENRERMKDAGDVAEDFGDSLEDASSGADKLGSGLSVATVAMGNLISSGIQAALSGIQELGSAIWNLDEATEEYRVAQGKLTTAFEAAGYSGDAAQKSYTEFYKILGDTDTATEASQLLAQLAENEQDITKWTNIAAGVYGTFGDALPIEGMIESANETAKVGEVTGYAHILARRAEGDDIHRFNLPAVHPGDIAIVLHKRQPLCGHPDGERLDLRSPHGGNAGEQAAQGETAGAVKEAAESQFIQLVPPPLLQGRSTSSFLRFSPQKYPPAGCRSPRPCGG